MPLAAERIDLAAAVRRVAAFAAERAPALDVDGAFPDLETEALADEGLLAAPLPRALGGEGLGTEPAGALPLLGVLRTLGSASLPLGRLYEGHVNALKLVCLYGDDAGRRRAAADARAGHLFGVWNTERPPGLMLRDGRLVGAKVHASGAGFVRRALVTARADGDDAPVMVLARLRPDDLAGRADLAPWTGVHGMRASATGTFDFTGIEAGPGDVIGRPGDYTRQPAFAAGAWRFAAVQAGGVERLVALFKAHLLATNRDGAPSQRARFGEAMIAAETARLWLERAAPLAEDANADPATAVAYVNLARIAVERAGLDVLERVHRGVGMAGFAGGQAIGRVSRDLQLYLRQPAPDAALDAAAAHGLGHAGFLSDDVA